MGVGTFKSEASPAHVEEIAEKVSEVSCGNNHTVAVTKKGKLWVMGSNLNGELGIGKKYDNQCVPVQLKELGFASIKEARAGSFNAVLSTENQLYFWGKCAFGDFYTPHRVKCFRNMAITDFRISSCGSAYVLTSSGRVYAWGDNSFG